MNRDQPFPRLNERATFKQRVIRILSVRRES